MRDQEQVSSPRVIPTPNVLRPCGPQMNFGSPLARQDNCHYILILDGLATRIDGSHFLTPQNSRNGNLCSILDGQKTVCASVQHNVKRGSRSLRRDQLYSSPVQSACGDSGEEDVVE